MNLTNEITSFINSIRELTGVGICYYDLKSFFNYDKYGEKDNKGHYCEFCKKARLLPNGREYCEKSDRIDAVELARQYKEPFFFECHMGMREYVIPLIIENVLLGIVFVGQCRTNDDYETRIVSNAKKRNGDTKEFLDLYKILPVAYQKDLINIGNILMQYFNIKISNSEFLLLKINSTSIQRDLAETIKQFIENNYKADLSLNCIANELYVNSSYASRCFSSKFGITVTDYITHIRIERAKKLLLTTEAPIKNIALNVGFQDANYFSRQFKKATDCSPIVYRKRKINPQ